VRTWTPSVVELNDQPSHLLFWAVLQHLDSSTWTSVWNTLLEEWLLWEICDACTFWWCLVEAKSKPSWFCKINATEPNKFRVTRSTDCRLFQMNCMCWDGLTLLAF
jgi:hypothetical protein